MNVPKHYKQAWRLMIRFALLMISVGLLFGIMYRESTRRVAMLPQADHWAATEHLVLVHGHTFLLGVLIPVAVMALMYHSLLVGGRELKASPLLLHVRLYLIGAFASICLLVYKGYHYVLAVRAGELDFQIIAESMFGGNELLRGASYAISHILMGSGLSALALSLWFSLENSERISE